MRLDRRLEVDELTHLYCQHQVTCSLAAVAKNIARYPRCGAGLAIRWKASR